MASGARVGTINDLVRLPCSRRWGTWTRMSWRLSPVQVHRPWLCLLEQPPQRQLTPAAPYTSTTLCTSTSTMVRVRVRSIDLGFACWSSRHGTNWHLQRRTQVQLYVQVEALWLGLGYVQHVQVEALGLGLGYVQHVQHVQVQALRVRVRVRVTSVTVRHVQVQALVVECRVFYSLVHLNK